MSRATDDYEDDVELTTDDLDLGRFGAQSPEMTPEELAASSALYNSYIGKEDKEETPFKPMNSFLSEIFDHKRDEPAEIPLEIGRGDRDGEDFQKFLQRNPTGIAPQNLPQNIMSDLYDAVYEEGPLLCKKVSAHSTNGIGDKTQPLHIKPIGCCPNNADGKPFGPGKACCCGHVYNVDSHFCCDQSHGRCEADKFSILEDTESNRKKCWKTQTCTTELKTSLVELSCTDSVYHGSNCDFTCPSGFDLAGLDQASCDPKTGNWQNLWGALLEETPCCKRKCDTKDPNYKLDFFIILDQSSSVGKENFEKMKNFVINLLLQSNLGQTGVRVGLVTYNRKPQLRFHMNEMGNHQEAIDAVKSIHYEGAVSRRATNLQNFTF